MQAKHIDDDWNVDSNKHSSDAWRGFTKPTLLKEKNAIGYTWSGARLTKIRTTTRPDHVWPEVWTRIGKAPQNREKQAWAREKPKLDKARRLRGIYCVDPDDRKCQKLSKMRGENWKDPWRQPCCARVNLSITKVRSQRLEMKRDPKREMVEKWNLMNTWDSEHNVCNPKSMKIALLEKDLLRWHITIWCTSFCRCHKRWKFRMQKLPWTMNGKSSRRFQHRIRKKNQEQEGGCSSGAKRKQECPLCVDSTQNHRARAAQTFTTRANGSGSSRQGSRVAVSSLCAWKESVIWCCTCLTLCGRLTCLPPRTLPLLHLTILTHTQQVHHAHLQAILVIKQRHQEPLLREDLQSGGNPRTTTPTGLWAQRASDSLEDLQKKRSISIVWCTRKICRRRSPSSFHRRTGGIW